MSYKRTTIVICSINIFIALYVLHSLYTSVYVYPFSDTQRASTYTPYQIRKMEESIQLRKQLEPVELINVVNGLKNKLLMDEKVQQIPEHTKEKITDEILVALKGVNPNADASVLQGLLARALGDDWAELSEEIGLWIPGQIINKEHDDKPEGELDYEIIAGKQLPIECHAEVHTDYGGDAVRWGLTHHKESAYDCCMACLNQAKHAGPHQKKCNIWVYCSSETGCHSPDIYQHKHHECWLKYAENPTVNFKHLYPESYRNAHPSAPVIVPWMSGVVSV
ncbi:unnamed protein product [Withania somnifera]